MNPGGPSLIAATLPDSLINPNRDRPNLEYEFLGVTRVWRWTRERMQKAYEDGLIVQSKPGRVPQLMRFLDEQRGRPLGDVWTDIPPINSQAKERLGYQTQKPLKLLERIIRMSRTDTAHECVLYARRHVPGLDQRVTG